MAEAGVPAFAVNQSRTLSLSICSAHKGHPFFDLPPLLRFVSGIYRLLDTVTNVVLENLLLQSTECRTDCGDLRNYIDAVTVFLDHAREATHLSLDSVQPLCGFRLDVFTHCEYIPLLGMGSNPLLEGDRKSVV